VRSTGNTLTGEISPVLNGALVGVLIVPAADDAAAGDVALFEVSSAAAAAALEITPLASLDHCRSLAQDSRFRPGVRAARGVLAQLP
jgi:hypothetical protein